MNYNDLEATKIKPQAYKNESRGRSVNVEAEDIMKDAEALLAKPIATKDMNKEYDTLVDSVIDDSKKYDNAFAMPTKAPPVDTLVQELENGGKVMNVHSDIINKLYKMLEKAETGGEDDPWIRTNVNPRDDIETGKIIGSSAYGPVQMTGGANSMIQNILNKPWLQKEIGLNQDDIEYAKRFTQQAQNFLLYGGGDWKEMVEKGQISPEEGKTISETYEYGMPGMLTSDADKKSYETLAKKIMQYEYDRAGQNELEFIKNWRYGSEDERTIPFDSPYLERMGHPLYSPDDNVSGR